MFDPGQGTDGPVTQLWAIVVTDKDGNQSICGFDGGPGGGLQAVSTRKKIIDWMFDLMDTDQAPGKKFEVVRFERE